MMSLSSGICFVRFLIMLELAKEPEAKKKCSKSRTNGNSEEEKQSDPGELSGNAESLRRKRCVPVQSHRFEK